jgi:hypothetical protein
MKIQSTDAQAWWIALPDEIRPARGIDGPKLASGIQSIFEFPAPPSEMKGGGVEFLNGRLRYNDREILIAKIVIFNDGINVHVPSDTEDAEVALQHALSFFFELGVRRPTTHPLHFFQSTIVADFECSLESIIPRALLKKISKGMPIEGTSHLFNIGTNFDPEEIRDGRWRGINPTVFRIERRTTIPYEVNRYFCLANLKSSDHIEAINDFEQFALRASN